MKLTGEVERRAAAALREPGLTPFCTNFKSARQRVVLSDAPRRGRIRERLTLDRQAIEENR
jgi:hypothetical protein